MYETSSPGKHLYECPCLAWSPSDNALELPDSRVCRHSDAVDQTSFAHTKLGIGLYDAQTEMGVFKINWRR